jgi:hypothetical protein
MAERAVAMAREAPEDPYAGLADPGELARDWDLPRWTCATRARTRRPPAGRRCPPGRGRRHGAARDRAGRGRRRRTACPARCIWRPRTALRAAMRGRRVGVGGGLHRRRHRDGTRLGGRRAHLRRRHARRRRHRANLPPNARWPAPGRASRAPAPFRCLLTNAWRRPADRAPAVGGQRRLWRAGQAGCAMRWARRCCPRACR